MTRLIVPVRFALTFSAGLLIGVLSLGSTLAPSQSPLNVQFGPDIMLGGAGNYEPAIAVNPLDPHNLVAGFFELNSNSSIFGPCHSAFTTDGGLTWSLGGDPPQPQKQDICGDVSLGADLLGNIYYAYINFQDNTQVAKSMDGGRTFPSSSIAAIFIDKPYMAVDAQVKSPFQGNIYVSYEHRLARQAPRSAQCEL